MEAFLIYELKSAVILAVFYIFWKLLLSRETLHRLNRVVLLSTTVLSLVLPLPLCIIAIKKTVVMPAQAASETISSLPQIPEVQPATTADGSAWWVWLLFWIWALGVVVVLTNTAISAIKVYSIIRKGKEEHLPDRTTVTVVEGDIAPFSWFDKIVVSRKDLKGEHREIILHEQAHIALKHSWDVLFTDILTSFQWFNPTVWMLRSDLRELHEYQADEKVLQESVNPKEYQYLLIRKATGDLGYSVTNSFNHSTLKNRFIMMTRKQSSNAAWLKALYILPLIALSLSLTAKIKTVYEYPETEQQVAKQTQNSSIVDIHLSVNENGEPVIKTSGNVNTEAKHKTARISADANVPMSHVDKLKEKLCSAGFLKVIYVKPAASESTITRNIAPAQNENKITVQKAPQYPKEYPAALRDNMCIVKINSNDRIFFKDNAYSDDENLINIGTDFIRAHGNKTLFLFTHESGTSYKAYVHMQDLLMRCYEQVRDEKAIELYGKNFSVLNDTELHRIYDIYPANIVEVDGKK